MLRIQLIVSLRMPTHGVAYISIGHFIELLANILVIADSSSGWLEAACMSESHHGHCNKSAVCMLREIWCTQHHRIGQCARVHVRAQFRGWLEAIGCRLLHTSEYHPQSNGTAERMVRAIKDAMKCYIYSSLVGAPQFGNEGRQIASGDHVE